jgi:hypothetical protein
LPNGEGEKMAHKTHCERYLNEKRRIRNKNRILEKRINKLIKSREKGIVTNPNNNLEIKRKSIDDIKQSCKIGRQRERIK